MPVNMVTEQQGSQSSKTAASPHLPAALLPMSHYPESTQSENTRVKHKTQMKVPHWAAAPVCSDGRSTAQLQPPAQGRPSVQHTHTPQTQGVQRWPLGSKQKLQRALFKGGNAVSNLERLHLHNSHDSVLLQGFCFIIGRGCSSLSVPNS